MAYNILNENDQQKYHQPYDTDDSACYSVCNGCLDDNYNNDNSNLELSSWLTQTSVPSEVATLPSAPEIKNARELHAEGMKNLSLEEREQVYEDIHGVGDIINEDIEFVACKLNSLEIEICNIENKYAYTLAAQMSKQFVYDRKFRIMFLRSCLFDTKETAKKIVLFFELKLELFGQRKLTKRIVISDLDDDDQHSITSGRCQILPFRDRAGRAIVANLAIKTFRLRTVDAMVRALWYTYMSAVEDDEESQRRGIVNIMHLLGSFDKEDPKERQLMWRARGIRQSLPYRVTCVHFCLNKKRLLTLAAVLAKGFMSNQRARMKFHYGSHTECEFSLMTYGIPLHALPLSSDGTVRFDNHLKWVQRRMILENSMLQGQYFYGIELPTKNDVLLGKGKPIQNHLGNERLREIVKQYKEQYDTCKKKDKPSIGDTIVRSLKSSGCRFLKQDPKTGYWFEVPHDIARTKVCAGFRTLRFIANNNTIRDNCPPKVVKTTDGSKRVRI